MSGAERGCGAPEFTVEQLDWIINRAVKDRDFQAISAALHVLAVQAPDRAEQWRQTLLLAVRVGKAAHDV
jgi:hypothetical protein